MGGIKPVFGGGGIRAGGYVDDPEKLKPIFETLKKGNCSNIDTAALYGESEEFLGKAAAGQDFTLDTKTKGGFGGSGHANKENIMKEAENSKKMLGVNVDIYYIHAPDEGTPLEETMEAINDVYKTGFFKRFGLSNFKVGDVQKAYDICKEKGYVLPSVYQGNYSPVARLQETLLFPTLRKLGIAFYAYSPIAGGFLTKTKQEIQDGAGRFDTSKPIGQMYGGMYSKPSYLEALGEWEKIAKDEGISRADLAYRWVTYNSPLKPEYGDAIIVGARNTEQLAETLASVQAGSLSDGAVKRIDEVWKKIEHEAPLDNFHR